MRRILILALVFASAVAGAASAQSIDSLASEQAVRVWTRALGTEGVRATVVRAGPESLTVRVRSGGLVVTVPNDSVWRLEVRSGNHRGRGAVLGGLGGLVLGGVGGYLASRAASALVPDCPSCKYGPMPSERAEWKEQDKKLAEQVGIAAAGAGLVAGGWWGSRRLVPKWTRVALPGRVGFSPNFQRPTASYGVSLAWRF